MSSDIPKEVKETLKDLHYKVDYTFKQLWSGETNLTAVNQKRYRAVNSNKHLEFILLGVALSLYKDSKRLL